MRVSDLQKKERAAEKKRIAAGEQAAGRVREEHTSDSASEEQLYWLGEELEETEEQDVSQGAISGRKVISDQGKIVDTEEEDVFDVSDRRQVQRLAAQRRMEKRSRMEKHNRMEKLNRTEERSSQSGDRARKFTLPRRGPVILVAGGIVLALLFLILGIFIFGGEKESTEVSASKAFYSRKEVEALLWAAKEEEAQRILTGIQQNLEDGMSTTTALRPFYTDKVVIATGGRVRFFPIQEEVEKNEFSQENLVELENGELQYVEEGQVISHKGIDVSYHQGVIDWKQVAEDGVEFAFIRVGIRGYGTGKVVLDEQFDNNVKGALANGIKVGVYFYSQSVNQEEVLEEAKLVLTQIAPYRITGPVVYDAEKVNDSRTSNLSGEERTQMAIAFCEAIEEAGYRPMVYVNLDTAFTMYEMEQLEEYDKWVAHYGSQMYYPYDYTIWQYSDSGTVAGINSKVDLNISFEEWE